MRTGFELVTGSIAALDTTAATAGPDSGPVTRPPGRVAPEQPVVLMVPGYTGSKEDFFPLLRPLADAGYRAVAIDQRGQYESGWAASAAGYSIEALAGEICEIAAELAPGRSKLHLLGHSFGGLVTRAAVLAKAELFDSFTLMGSGPAALTGQRRALLDAGEAVLARHGMAGLWSQLEARSQTDPKYRQSPAALLSFLRTRFLANDPLGLRVMGDALRTVADRTAELASVRLPMLVLHGEADDAWPPPVQADMARRLGAAHAVIGDAAHSPAVENPQHTVRALLEFWQNLE